MHRSAHSAGAKRASKSPDPNRDSVRESPRTPPPPPYSMFGDAADSLVDDWSSEDPLADSLAGRDPVDRKPDGDAPQAGDAERDPPKEPHARYDPQIITTHRTRSRPTGIAVVGLYANLHHLIRRDCLISVHGEPVDGMIAGFWTATDGTPQAVVMTGDGRLHEVPLGELRIRNADAEIRVLAAGSDASAGRWRASVETAARRQDRERRIDRP